MQYLRHIDILIKFCIVGAVIALTVVVHQSTGELSSSVQSSSKAIENEIKGLKETLNISQIQTVLNDIQMVLTFISEQLDKEIVTN